MKTEEIALSRIAENENNPRTITTEKFKKLVKSLLVFPRMLTLRPIVVDETMTVLGGNMRLKALKHIVTMDADAMRSTIEENDKFSELEVANLVSYWTDWRNKPTATIINAADLTEAQKREFIIKDNVGFGDWDTDMLANNWDTAALKDWGVNEWLLTGFSKQQSNATTEDNSAYDDAEPTDEQLPPELQGRDINPDKLPDIQGTDETEKKRIIIVYAEEQEEYLAALIGVPRIDKVVYNVDELKDE